MTSLFESKPNDQMAPDNTQVKYEDYVGPDKKYKDNDAAAKAIFEKDRFIDRLKMEQDELRKELKTRLGIEEFMTELKKTGNSNREPQVPVEPPVTSPASIKPEDITKIVQQKLEEERNIASTRQNVDTVKRALAEAWGNNFGEVLESKAISLGVSKEYLAKMAEEQPNALLLLVGINDTARQPAREQANNPVRSSVNTAGFLSSNKSEGQMKWDNFEKLRKENPKKYWSRQVQNEIHKIALTREDFLPSRR